MNRLRTALFYASALCMVAAAPMPRPVQLVVVGDSVAFGQGATDPRKSFAFLVYMHIAATHPGSSIVNRSIGGARIADVRRLELASLPKRADVVVVEAGANDVLHGMRGAAVASDETALLHAIRDRCPRAIIVVGGIPDLSISPIFIGARHSEIHKLSSEDNRAIRTVVAQQHALFVDVFALSRRIGRNAAPFLGSDNFHPSDRGHAAIAALIEPALDQALAAEVP